MALNSIVETLREIWDLWGIRGCIIFSLSLQIFLFLFAPLRRKTASMVMNFLIWSAYLLADWVPPFTAGLILKSLSTSTAATSNCSMNSATGPPGVNDDLLALWAASLLWHLGGSFSITAFALEDNELWFRHSTIMAVQFMTACYIFLRTLPDNRLAVPTIFTLLGGLFSNVLRAKSMHLASLDKYRKDIVKEHDSLDYPDGKELDSHIGKLQVQPVDQTPVDLIFMLETALQYFKFFKGLVVNIKCQANAQQQIAESFRSKACYKSAYRVISCELNFMYEMFYTNRIALARRFGNRCWLISFVSCTIVLGLFVQAEKQHFHDVDIRISNALVIVPLALCLMAPYFLSYGEMSVFLSKEEVKEKSWRDIFTFIIINLRFQAKCFCGNIGLRESKIKIEPDIMHEIDGTMIFFREWSESICSHNLISYCLKEQPRIISRPNRPWAARICKILYIPFQVVRRVVLFLGKLSITAFRKVRFLGLVDILERAMYVSRDPFDKELWNFIFVSLRSASIYNEAGKLTSKVRGGWALRDSNHSTRLLDYIKDVEYDECLLRWHIATELCYNTVESNPSDKETRNNRVFSKMLSDYMLYLMVFQPGMMSTVSGTFLGRYERTHKKISESIDNIYLGGAGGKLKEACGSILNRGAASVQPHPENGDGRRDILSRACTLTEELKELSEEERWRVLSHFWLEMLVYAARNCRGDIHARSLCRGGELLSLVWLLMAHFGLIEAVMSSEEKSSEIQSNKQSV